ncbi:unknown protein (plasmid) [Synechocystis sp. PCC 6803]|jgi:chromosome segregation ATPase|uniref:Phosphomannomutase n=1 Tax=Synechocystis sp. (strain ATCC 27184 / PCC 6803 / Kazusa) TaxID=1111708 RepID=Q6ZES9_SYNY3|nr:MULTISPECIES: hypothetical protein [unclassified Synechocystis]WLT40352.1 hypothetical protein NON20_24840 [Synechocystis sp. B12]AGF53478.1 hypothetical protein MYO_2520 [Synechocystis sp. PCC 6803]AVP91599.1 hypothetical protein C7I86_17710 [Synechocystis sp. IPPAS B-1465]MBD2619849.1 hypothetical protein [Synechocystis sp. FACHB-898]MBD2639474.1 hypothetical protein [Synechocystis sp. FACHB-908]
MPTVETDLAQILERIDGKLDRIEKDISDIKVSQAEVKGEIRTLDERLSGQIKATDEKLSGQIKTTDEKLSGQIKTLDERLSGEISTLDEKVTGIGKRLENQEFTSRGILTALIIALIAGAAKFFGIFPNP